MSYVLGASFSNVQHSFNSPTYFVAFAVQTTRKFELEEIKTKEEMQEDHEFNKNLFDLSIVENEINRFKDMTVKSSIIKLTKAKRKEFNDDLSFILYGFLKAIESVRSSRLHIASEGFEKCYLHVPLDSNGKGLVVEDLEYFNHPISKYNIRFQKKGEFDPILELARLGAWFEYLDMMRRKPAFINKQISKNENLQFVQFLRLIWNSPPIESYPDSFVGYPRMVLKTQNDTYDLIIHPGTQLDLFAISQACSGLGNGLNVPRCKRASAREPFGSLSLHGGFEKCRLCSEDSRGSLCLYQKPKCDGKEIQCRDKVFATQVCDAEFSVYLTLYKTKIKVGRAIKSRIIGRLIEQCAFDGLVFYPIPGLPLADHLEERLVVLLGETATDLGMEEVSAFTEKVTSKERFEHILSLGMNTNIQTRRDNIYDRITDILKTVNSPEAAYLSALEQRKVHLSRNWIGCKGTGLNENSAVRDFLFRRISGNVTGVVGSFIIVDDGAYDTTKMEGYINGVSVK
jgi:hypothetical protein